MALTGIISRKHNVKINNSSILTMPVQDVIFKHNIQGSSINLKYLILDNKYAQGNRSKRICKIQANHFVWHCTGHIINRN